MPPIPNEIFTGGLSGIIFFFGVKYLIPVFISKVSAEKAVNNVGESLLRQIAEQLDSAYRQRKEEADRADEFFIKWSEAENKVTLLTYQLEQANKQISDLIVRIERLEKK